MKGRVTTRKVDTKAPGMPSVDLSYVEDEESAEVWRALGFSVFCGFSIKQEGGVIYSRA